ncbi:MAG: hypothetical protein LZF62_410023 [Nitrospira sp.]|nr:MAG: hypothetical protein LZF62_410023 [Nitrospira sp.]
MVARQRDRSLVLRAGSRSGDESTGSELRITHVLSVMVRPGIGPAVLEGRRELRPC